MHCLWLLSHCSGKTYNIFYEKAGRPESENESQTKECIQTVQMELRAKSKYTPDLGIEGGGEGSKQTNKNNVNYFINNFEIYYVEITIFGAYQTTIDF